jgi:hypothetical protein
MASGKAMSAFISHPRHGHGNVPPAREISHGLIRQLSAGRTTRVNREETCRRDARSLTFRRKSCPPNHAVLPRPARATIFGSGLPGLSYSRCSPSHSGPTNSHQAELRRMIPYSPTPTERDPTSRTLRPPARRAEKSRRPYPRRQRIRSLQPVRYLPVCSDRFRLERSPGIVS